jgi:transcription initiation factor IIE alpha subunit
MADLTIYAEALIQTVVRAFYDDEIVVLVDVLIRDKFLRDDDMSLRLNLPARKLRASLQFLQDEHLVKAETVDDLAQGGSQATKFYYLDYCTAVHSIRLRLFLLKRQLEQAELNARSASYYICPGYKIRRCNGKYTEEDVQQFVDPNTGLFMCFECQQLFANNPEAPGPSEYTLQLVDNSKELQSAMNQLRRFNAQMSSKFIGNLQLRPSIYDLLQKVRGGGGSSNSGSGVGNNDGTAIAGAGNSNINGQSFNQMNNNSGLLNGSNLKNATQFLPITSNLPSENFALGIGSKRLAGTGRTAGIKAKKLEQQGVAPSAAQARSYLVGGAAGPTNNEGDGAANSASIAAAASAASGMIKSTLGVSEKLDYGDFMFLKNALGNEIHFAVERGGGARAQLLASKTRKRQKLLEAAACRVGTSVPLHIRVLAHEINQRKYQRAMKRLAREQKREEQRLLILAAKEKDRTQNEGGDTGGTDPGGDGRASNQSKKKKSSSKGAAGSEGTFSFLEDNIGRSDVVTDDDRAIGSDADSYGSGTDDDVEHSIIDMLYFRGGIQDRFSSTTDTLVVLSDAISDEIAKENTPDDQKIAAFQALYKVEVSRQTVIIREELENIRNQSELDALGQQSTGALIGAQADAPVEWEDGALPSISS